MGLKNWFKKRAERKMKAKLDKASKFIMSHLSGKDAAQLASEGGWELLGNFGGSKRSESPWIPYSDSRAEQLYELLSIIFANVKKIADTAGVFPYTVMAFDSDGEKEEFPDHPILNLVEHPNDKMSYSEFIFNVVSHLEISGVSYIWKSRNNSGVPDGLWPFPTTWIQEVTNKEGKLLHYQAKRDKFRLDIKMEDMVIIRYPSPGNPLGVAGPTQACFKDAQMDEARADYMIEMMVNMHLPGPVFSSEEAWTEDQMKLMRRNVTDKIGNGKRGKPLFVGGPGSKVEMVDPLSDMDWPGTAGLSETRVCATYEVPPILIHLRSGLDRSTYSNYETAKRAFYQGKMLSVVGKLADAFSLYLLHAEGDVDFWFEAVVDDIPELQEDLTEKHERARADWVSGGLTYDEYLEIIGSEPIGGRDGEMRLLPMGVQPFYPNEELPEPFDTTPGTEEEEEEGFITDDGEDDEEIEDEETVVEEEGEE